MKTISRIIDRHVGLAEFASVDSVGIGVLDGRTVYYAAVEFDLPDRVSYLVVGPDDPAELMDVLAGERPLRDLLDGTIAAQVSTLTIDSAGVEVAQIASTPDGLLPPAQTRLNGVRLDAATIERVTAAA